MDIRTVRLNQAFEASRLSQTELCRLTGINKGALSSYLSGRYLPKQSALEKLAQILHVDILWLMALDENTNPTSSPAPLHPAAARVAEIMEDLNEEGVNKIIEYAEDISTMGKYKKCDPVSEEEMA